jgi:sRNA-binding carbon storage regulator CsrA
VLSARGDRVRIGVTAPEHIRVDRQEVHARRADYTEGPHLARSGAAMSHVARSLRNVPDLRRHLAAIAASCP